jgi:hypothetical protein
MPQQVEADSAQSRESLQVGTRSLASAAVTGRMGICARISISGSWNPPDQTRTNTELVRPFVTE